MAVVLLFFIFLFFFFKQKTAYEIPKRDWSSDVCSSDLERDDGRPHPRHDRPCHRGDHRHVQLSRCPTVPLSHWFFPSRSARFRRRSLSSAVSYNMLLTQQLSGQRSIECSSNNPARD